MSATPPDPKPRLNFQRFKKQTDYLLRKRGKKKKLACGSVNGALHFNSHVVKGIRSLCPFHNPRLKQTNLHNNSGMGLEIEWEKNQHHQRKLSLTPARGRGKKPNKVP